MTTMPYVSACDGSTSRSAAAYARSSSAPVSGPGEVHPVVRAAAHLVARTPGRGPGCPRTRTATTPPPASASSSTSWPLSRVTGATHRSASPAALPGARSAGSTPGSATCTHCRAYSSSSRRRVHSLVVTTAVAAARTSRSRPSPSGMCIRTTWRSLRACGTSASGAGDAISPSSRTTAPSGSPRITRVSAAPGHGVLVDRPAERGEPSRRPCGRRCCRRSAARDRRFPRARPDGPPSQRPLVARPRDV